MKEEGGTEPEAAVLDELVGSSGVDDVADEGPRLAAGPAQAMRVRLCSMATGTDSACQREI